MLQKHHRHYKLQECNQQIPTYGNKAANCLGWSVEASSGIEAAADTLPLSQAFDKWSLMNPNLHRDSELSMLLYFISCFQLLLKEHIFNEKFLTENAVQM